VTAAAIAAARALYPAALTCTPSSDSQPRLRRTILPQSTSTRFSFPFAARVNARLSPAYVAPTAGGRQIVDQTTQRAGVAFLSTAETERANADTCRGSSFVPALTTTTCGRRGLTRATIAAASEAWSPTSYSRSMR
jgi:hypothetical protein